MTSKGKKAKVPYGVLIQVLELPRQRAFYRDVLQLGNPAVDSTFWVEFPLPGGGILVLEQCDNVVPNNTKREVAWLYAVDDFEKMIERLRTWEVREVRPIVEIPGKRCITFADPEGNPFTLYSEISVDGDPVVGGRNGER